MVRLIGGNAIVMTDASTRFGTVGFALPAAIGAKIATPDADVWAIVDGRGFQMMQAELTTAAQENVKVNVVVISSPTPLRSPDVVTIAEAHGLAGLRADTSAAVEEVVQRARRADGSVVIDFPVEVGEVIFSEA
jgi:acetolactate synthase-1/2/3 large subunit